MYCLRGVTEMKKKIVVLILAMVTMFCLLLTGCGGNGGDGIDYSDSPYIGTWTAVSVSMGDEEEPFTDKCDLIVNSDGTGSMTDEEETTEFTWKPTDEGFKTKGDVKMTFKGDGEKISGKILGANLNFEKQQ